MEPFEEAERKIQYTFKDQELRRLALTHGSSDRASVDARRRTKKLSWLGDSVLNFLVTDEVFRRFPNASKSDLQESRKRVTNNEALGRAATGMDLDSVLLKGASLDKNPAAKDRHRMLANAVETIIGAVYLDGTLEDARAVVRLVVEAELASALRSVSSNRAGQL